MIKTKRYLLMHISCRCIYAPTDRNQGLLQSDYWICDRLRHHIYNKTFFPLWFPYRNYLPISFIKTMFLCPKLPLMGGFRKDLKGIDPIIQRQSSGIDVFSSKKTNGGKLGQLPPTILSFIGSRDQRNNFRYHA
jgi:hypothetical protein